MKISDVLWKAANECLWDGVSRDFRELFCCYAVDEAADMRRSVARSFIEELLGSEVAISGSGFDQFARGAPRQGARYLFLLFAHEVAKDEAL